MCDRCSHSHFHALHLNNSPRADNPRTLDHLHGTAEPGKFRLLPSVGLRATAAPIAPGHSWNWHLLGRTCISFLFFFPLHALPVPPLQACFVQREAFSSAISPANSTRTGSRPSRGARLQSSCSGTSAAIVAASPVGRDVPAAEASYVQPAAASGWKRWHLLAAFLSLPSLSLSSLPYREPRRTPAGRGLRG